MASAAMADHAVIGTDDQGMELKAELHRKKGHNTLHIQIFDLETSKPRQWSDIKTFINDFDLLPGEKILGPKHKKRVRTLLEKTIRVQEKGGEEKEKKTKVAKDEDDDERPRKRAKTEAHAHNPTELEGITSRWIRGEIIKPELLKHVAARLARALNLPVHPPVDVLAKATIRFRFARKSTPNIKIWENAIWRQWLASENLLQFKSDADRDQLWNINSPLTEAWVANLQWGPKTGDEEPPKDGVKPATPTECTANATTTKTQPNESANAEPHIPTDPISTQPPEEEQSTADKDQELTSDKDRVLPCPFPIWDHRAPPGGRPWKPAIVLTEKAKDILDAKEFACLMVCASLMHADDYHFN